MIKLKSALLSIMLGCSLSSAFAQKGDERVSQLEKEKTITAVANIISKNYVFPDVGKQISTLLLKKLNQGDYESVTDHDDFATVLTADVQSFNRDKHLRVLFEPDRIKTDAKPVNEAEREKKRQARLKKQRINNYGFKEIKILQGNIGYLNLTDLDDPSVAGDTAAAAMKMLENSYAIIIDLRENGGGPPSMVQLLASYFLAPQPVLLNSFYKRKENITKQFWSLPYVKGNRMPDTPLYLLTSSKTFSAAEEFCYDFQQMKRAIVIGENTIGGAHPGGRVKATKHYNVWTPTARAINPISNKNWEGIGIKPNLAVPAENALQVAHKTALALIKSTKSDL